MTNAQMKVLLIQPPIEDFYDTGIRTYPLALLYLAARVRNICDITVADMRSNKRTGLQEHPFPDLTDFYRRDVRSPFSLFGSYYRFGMNREQIGVTIFTQKPDLVGISALFTTYSREAFEVARITKEINRETLVVMGGTHATIFPDDCLDSPYVDYVIRGEGETPLFELIHALKKGRQHTLTDIDGLCFDGKSGRHISQIAIEQNISLSPSRELVPARNYRIGKKQYAFMLTSRGCPFHCSFCGKPPVPYRKRSLAGIEEDIAACIHLGIDAIDFEDDMLNLDVRFFMSVLKLFQDKQITLSAMNGLYVRSLNTKILDAMFRSGFRRLNFSLVDISCNVHNEQQRAFPDHLTDLLAYLESTAFLTEVHFIIGLPGQTPHNAMETMMYLMGKRVLPGPSIYYLAPNSPLFNAEPHNRNINPEIMRSSAMFPCTLDFSRETIFTLTKLQRFINLVKGILDRNPGASRLSDFIGASAAFSRPHDSHIFDELVLQKRFVSYNNMQDKYTPDLQNKGLIESFFSKIKGQHIKGFKTRNSLVADI